MYKLHLNVKFSHSDANTHWMYTLNLAHSDVPTMHLDIHSFLMFTLYIWIVILMYKLHLDVKFSHSDVYTLNLDVHSF